MKSMLVLFAVCAVAYGYGPLAQPAHLPALVLDARGRPLDTAEVINSRALHLQAKALEGNWGWNGAYGYGNSWLGNGLGIAGHYLHKRSLGHWGHAAPAVSHQSRLDVISSPAIVSHGIAAPVVSHAVATPVLTALPVAQHGIIAGHHGHLTPINHAAVAPIGLGVGAIY